MNKKYRLEQPSTEVVDVEKPLVIHWRVESWFPDLPSDRLALLKRFHDELLKMNKQHSLVSAKALPHADLVHFADSIFASRFVREKANNNEDMYDLGSGNGFPGLVYAILYPDQKVILLDQDSRKTEVLSQIVKALELQNVSVVCKSAEKLSEGQIKQAICRNFAPLPKSMMMLRKIVPKGCNIFYLKTEEWSLEVSQVPSQLCSVWQPHLIGEYNLPIANIKMFVVRTEKLTE